MMRSGTAVVGVAIAALAGVWVGRVSAPDPPPVYREVEVPVERIIEREPDTVVRWRERLVVQTVTPRQIATAPGGAADHVSAFCRPQVLTVTDTLAAPPPPVILMRSVTTSNAWPLQRQNVLVTGVTSYGDLSAADFRVRPGWSVRTVGDSLLMREPRLGWWRDVVYTLAVGAIGYTLGGL